MPHTSQKARCMGHPVTSLQDDRSVAGIVLRKKEGERVRNGGDVKRKDAEWLAVGFGFDRVITGRAKDLRGANSDQVVCAFDAFEGSPTEKAAQDKEEEPETIVLPCQDREQVVACERIPRTPAVQDTAEGARAKDEQLGGNERDL